MRRFLLWRRQDATGVSGTGIVAEGVVFGDGVVAVRWRGETKTTTVHENLASVERVHCHAGMTRMLWCDTAWHGPLECERYRPDGKVEPGIRAPTDWLHDGWSEPNGAVDGNGVPLFMGQRVRLKRLHGEVSNEGEVTLVHASGGSLVVGLYGTDCGPTDYRIDEIEAIETTHKEAWDRNGGRKPSYGWGPALRIEDKP